MFKVSFVLTLLVSISSAALARPSLDQSSSRALSSVAEGQWLFGGREEDPLTGEEIFIWNWSEFPYQVETHDKVAPNFIPIDPGIIRDL